MLLRYFALIWDPSDPQQCNTSSQLTSRLLSGAESWQNVLRGDGFYVFCTGADGRANETYKMPGSDGVIVGKLFRANSEIQSDPSIRFSHEEVRRIVESKGAHLIGSYWGRYVAFWRDGAHKFVLRDPTGILPCYEAEFRGVRLYFSWLEDCLALKLLRFSVNWEYVSVILAQAIVHSRFTGLNEVTQVLQSERVDVAGARVERELLWWPSKFAVTDVLENVDAARSLLRRTVRRCVRSWARCYDGIVLRMSGGLDSTIVLSCLKDVPGDPSLTGLIHYSPNPRGDERPFARIAAADAGCALIECERRTDVRLQSLLQMHSLPEPHSCVPFTQNDKLESRIAAECNASAIFSGGGGDQIFYQARAGLATSDYVYRHGLRPSLLRVAQSSARLDQVSIWQVLRAAIKDRSSRHPFDPLADVDKYWHLLSPDLLKNVRQENRFVHPWMLSLDNIPPGKQWQLQGLYAPHVYYDPRGAGADAEYVRPLASQPLIELSLRIPTYILTHGGWDRALARRAFEDDIPATIATRRTKGAADVHLERVLANNIEFVRSTLLDGVLVRNRLIDGVKLEAVLTGNMDCVDSPIVEIFHYLTVESWLRDWNSLRAAVAA